VAADLRNGSPLMDRERTAAMPDKNINKWNAKHRKDIVAKRFGRINDYLKTVALLVAGLVATPLFNQWLTPLLPRPQADAS
jgi:hypothetical protein